MTYILIAYLLNGVHPETVTVEFATQDACQSALEQVMATHQNPYSWAICVPKGEL